MDVSQAKELAFRFAERLRAGIRLRSDEIVVLPIR